MTQHKKVYGHNSPELFPTKPLPPIFLGPPTHNGAIAARTITTGVLTPPPAGAVYVPPAVWTPLPPELGKELPAPTPRTGVIWGIITDCGTGSPIDHATVILDGRTDHTGPDGKYEFPDVVPGNYSLYVYKEL